MLSNEDALELIRRSERCFVVWAEDKGVIIAVHPLPAQDTIEQRIAPLSSMSTDYDDPTVGRYFESTAITLETLEAQQADILRVARRVEIFNAWQNCSTDELISILEIWSFSEPMDSYHGSSHIVEQIYRFRSSDLSDTQLDRLERIARSPSSIKLNQAARGWHTQAALSSRC
ncbi:MAG TPA: hypothetical protein VFQ92_09070, partial [Blastocatellia bacterium]|nr:hypothetical protein [Blastocatellia bacterium]